MLKEPTQKSKEEKFRRNVFQAEVKVVNMSLAKTKSRSLPAVTVSCPDEAGESSNSGRSECRKPSMMPLLTCCVAPSCLSPSLVPSLPSLQALNRDRKSLFFASFILHSSLAPWAGCSKSRALSSVPTSQCPQHGAQVWQRQFFTK